MSDNFISDKRQEASLRRSGSVAGAESRIDDTLVACRLFNGFAVCYVLLVCSGLPRSLFPKFQKVSPFLFPKGRAQLSPKINVSYWYPRRNGDLPKLSLSPDVLPLKPADSGRTRHPRSAGSSPSASI